MKYRIEKAAADYNTRFIKNHKHPTEGAFYESDIDEVYRLAKQQSKGRVNDLIIYAIMTALEAGFMIGYKKGRRDSRKPAGSATKLKTLRTVRGISLEELEDLSGIPLDDLKKIENGRQATVNTRALAKLSEAFGIEPSELLSPA